MKHSIYSIALLAALCAGAGYAADPAANSMKMNSMKMGSGGMMMKIPPYIQAAVDDKTRPEKDRQRDENRKPAEALAFAGIKPGQRVMELFPTRYYYTRLLCRVVGSKGHVYAMELNEKQPSTEAAPLPEEACATNITADSQPAGAPKFPTDLDVVWTTENYHDLKDDYWEGGIPDTKAFDAAVFKSLKPGGVFIVEDHVAAAGSGARDTATLHRIDPELVKQELTSVGFVFAGESKILRHPEDDHTAKVFTLKGKSDRFLFKFRKPRT